MEDQPSTTTPLETQATVPNPSPQSEQQKTKKPLARPIFLLLGVVIVLLIAAVSYDMYSNGFFGNSSNNKEKTTKIVTKSEPAVYNPNPVDPGVSWLSVEKALPNLGLIHPKETNAWSQEPLSDTDINYFLVGNDNGKDIIFAESDQYNGGYLIQLLKIDETHYQYLTKYSTKPNKTEWDKKITGENLKVYSTLEKQRVIEINNVTLVTSVATAGWFTNIQKANDIPDTQKKVYTKFASTPYGDIYLETLELEAGITTQEFILRVNNGTSYYYSLKEQGTIFNDSQVPQITWSNGEKNTETYRDNGIFSCGAPHGKNIIESSNLIDLKIAGKLNNGNTIYEFSNPNNKVVQNFYKGYEATYSTDAVSLADYLKTRPLLVYKDSLGRLELLNGGKYESGAECGKPVVYLYPTKTEKISVKVDAKITVSEPNYGNGWNVTAFPDGTIVNNDGKVYDSLFWEGTGKEYPTIVNGQIVAKADIAATLKNNLTELGLNEKESQDFLSFWLPKMPKSPYTRLTWFNTAQMNRLAPLSISPKPDTLIRIFLDFAPLNNPISLPTQKLTSISRKGFTVVEWGGLLRK